MPGGWMHLAGRFFSAIRSAPLDEQERDVLTNWLAPAELTLFLEQPAIDQRHGLEAARFVATRNNDSDLIRAAALHDVGKRHARLGVFGRVFASILLKLHLPVRGRYAVYRDHGPIGAVEIERAGSPMVAIHYARHHHDSRSPAVADSVWRLLTEADGASESRVRVRAER